MTQHIVIREYAVLTTAEVTTASLDCAKVSESAFAYLCELSASFRKSGANLLYLDGKARLKWDAYVGVLETPCGTTIEILPKHYECKDQQYAARALLKKLISAAFHLTPRLSGPASLALFNAPLHEWVMAQFLSECEHLIQRGLRLDYERVEAEERFLRGQLKVVEQLRQRPGREHYFHIRYDELNANRAENRLLKAALEKIERVTRSAANLQHAHRLRQQLDSIPASRDIPRDFKSWSSDRFMQHYRAIKPWCELVLGKESPQALKGEARSISLLFAMPALFEAYVAACLKKQLSAAATLTMQARSQHLCHYQGRPMFQLKPDLLIDCGQSRFILDTKWKRIDTRSGFKDLSQSDFYQLFAYGKKYARSPNADCPQPVLALIYPKWAGFDQPLEQYFDFGDGLTLWALPFDLDEEKLCWPKGDSSGCLLFDQEAGK